MTALELGEQIKMLAEPDKDIKFMCTEEDEDLDVEGIDDMGDYYLIQ